MTYLSKLDMSREEWLALRKQSVGASDVATLLNLNPYKTAYQLWEEKVLPGPLDTVENDAVHFGVKLEETVAQEYAERAGRKVLRDNKIRIHPECDFFTCNLDRVILPMNGEGRGVLECKTTSSFAASHWDTEIPPMYFTQVQAQLAITGYGWGVLALLVDGRTFKSYDIERDDLFISQMVQIVTSFWHHHVLARIAPRAVVADFGRMQSEPGVVVQATPEEIAACVQLAKVRADIAALEGNKEQLENTLKLAIGTGEILASGEEVLASWKTSKPSTSFDTKKFKADHPEMVAAYEIMKPGSRRFLLKEGK